MFKKATSVPDARLGQYDQLIVHVTATRPSQDWGAKEVDDLHKSIGWSGCGYHAVIRRNGDWEDHDSGFPARPIGRTGAHVGDCGRGQNRRSFGISMAGGVREDNADKPEFNMTAIQLETLREGILRFLSLHPRGVNSVRIMGHRDLIEETGASPKACPCFDVIPWWNGISSQDTGGNEDINRAPTSMNIDGSWVVASGETLSRIARSSGVSLSEILRLNPEITNADSIVVGQTIRLI